MLFCRESPTVPFGGEVGEDEIVFPGDGVPEQAGGVQVYVSPDVGLTVFDRVTVELFNVPVLVDPQFVVVVLLLKSVLAFPLKPISIDLVVALVGPCIL